MNLNWDQLRDITEASALFFREMLEQGEDMSTLGDGNSRNTPDLLAEVGLAWSNAVELRSKRMDGEYIEALDRYVYSLAGLHRHKLRLLSMSYADLYSVAVNSIDEIIHEWEEEFKERDHA